MSMIWMRGPGQSWVGAEASFLLMWDAMMAAMMLPSLVPALWRYRQLVGTTGAHLELLTMLAGLGYFCAWSLFGMLVFPLGACLAAAAMQWPAWAHVIPRLVGLIILIAGMLQFSGWKSRQLAHCRLASQHTRSLPVRTSSAWRQGARLGLHCCLSCANLTAIQLVLGVMDLRAMALVMAAITAERLAPAGQRIAEAIGVVIILAGALWISVGWVSVA